jgi:hypothetical protein
LVVSLETNWPVFRFNSGTHTCWLLVLLVVVVLVELAALLQALQGLPAPFIVFALLPCCEHVAAAEGVNAPEPRHWRGREREMAQVQ